MRRWPRGWMHCANSRQRPWQTCRPIRRNDPPTAAERHYRPGRRRPAWPNVGTCRRASRLSLPSRPGWPDWLRRFAAAVDVISFEFENVSAEGLDLLASLKPVRPSPEILRISQDRILEKTFLNRSGVATAPWMPVEDFDSLRVAVGRIGLPAILKTTRLGYDGKRQVMLREAGELPPAFVALSPKPLILEDFIDFGQEISVVAARGEDGAYAAFDTVENRHRNHILDLTLAPARIPESVDRQAQAIARRIADALDLVGLLAVEMFVDRDGRVLVNEIAPRPHNSGHWTIDACPASQFELHIRAIAGLPLPPATRHSD